MAFYHPFINGSKLVTNGLISAFNSNTLGNLFTTGGNVGVGKSNPTSSLDVNGTIKADTINATGITASNINFTGSLYQNGVTYQGSQWTTTSGNVSYTSGSIVGSSVSANNTIFTNSSIGTINASDITASNINFTGSLYQNGVAYSSSQWTTTSGNVSYTNGSIIGSSISASNIITSNATIGTLTISNFNPTQINTTSLTTANFIVGNLTTGTLVTNNVNVGVGSMFGGSFNAANNVAAPSNVTGFSFNSSNVASFTANVSVVISATSSLYEAFTLNGAYTSTGWVMTSTGRGDVSGVAFTITTGGQVQYTSTNVSGWTNSAFRFTINQNSINGNYSSLSAPTSGNTYIFDSISLTNTADALSLSSTGSMNIAGGLTVQKSLYAATISTSNFMITNLTAGTMVANNVNVGINSMYGGSFNAANNVAAASNVTGFSFNSASVVSFSANVSVIVTNSTVSYETFTLNGAYSSSGWILNSSSRGDVSGITFSITSVGQIQYTSTNVAGWTSSVFRFSVNQNSLTGNYSSLSAPTSGNTYIYDSINLTNTADAAAGSSIGSIYVSGGASVSKSLFVGTQISSANVISTNSTTGVLNANGITAGNINFTGSLYQNGTVYAPSTSLKGFQVSATTGNSLISFIACGYGGNNMAYSFDGINYTGVSSNSAFGYNISCNKVAYNGSNRWVAVGGSSAMNSIGYSSDGITWTGVTGTSVFSTAGYSVAYGGGKWVAVGQGTNTIAYSTDGISWTGIGTSIFSSGGLGVAYSSALSRWVAVGNGSSNSIAYSTDGISWTGIGKSIYSTEAIGVAYSSALSRWVAVGNGAANSIAYSTDGITWTGIGKSIFASAGNGVAYSSVLSRWVAAGSGTNHIAYSSDGISWTGLGTLSAITGSPQGISYNSLLGMWVIAATGTNAILYSTDGINWSGVTNTMFGGGNISGIGSNGITSAGLILSSQRVQYDTNSNYNNTTGTFTAPSSGIYTINLNGIGNVYITSANTFIPTQGSHTTTAYISAGNTLKCIIGGGIVYNWGVSYL